MKTTNPEVIAKVQSELAMRGVLATDYQVVPQPAYRLKSDHTRLFATPMVSEESLIPPLFEGYLRAGARVCREPAIDRAFRCADFFTIMDVTQMSKVFKRKYRP